MTETETQPRSKAITAELEKLKARANELQKKQGELATAAGDAREEQGQLVAKGEPADDVRTKLRGFLDETDGIARALEVIGRDVQRLEKELRAAELEEFTASRDAEMEHVKTRILKMREKLLEVAVWVEPRLVEIDAAGRSADVADGRISAITGVRRSPMQPGVYDRDWRGYTGLRGVVNHLLAFAHGATPEQRDERTALQMLGAHRSPQAKTPQEVLIVPPGVEVTPAEVEEEVVAV